MKYWIISVKKDADPHQIGEILKQNGFSDIHVMSAVRMISGAAEEQNAEKCRDINGVANIHEDGIIYSPQV